MSDETPTGPTQSALVERMTPFSNSIFGETSALATELGAINLGQGFPDTDGPEELKRIAQNAILNGVGNQYPPVHGMPDLRLAIAEHQHRFYGLDVDAESEVVVTTGASEALAAALLGLLDAYDEVIIFEPFFDLYPAAIALAGAKHVAVPLKVSSDDGWQSEKGIRGFRLDVEALEQAINSRTKMILLNSPHNPTGMVLTEIELREVARIAIENDLLVLSDEAYEHLVFAPARHIPIATLDGMWDRTITVGSGGKCFSFTGWKVGWATGPKRLIHAVRTARQHLSFVSSGPFQPAIAAGLRLPDSYFEGLVADMELRRDLLASGLRENGFEVLQTDGTYFITTDTGASGLDDRSFCEVLLRGKGVATIPNSALVDHDELFPNYVRWAFCKQPAALTAALSRLN